jgi:hypothetical protein
MRKGAARTFEAFAHCVIVDIKMSCCRYYLNELTYVTDPPKPKVPNPDSRSAAAATFQ